MRIKDKISRVDVGELIPYSNNPKKHPEEQIDEIASSIKNYGFVQPLVIDGDNEIIIGHGRLQAAKKLGMDEVPAIRADDLTDAEIKALRLADNKIAETGWDTEKLEVELEQLDEEDFDIELTGFDRSEFEEFKDENADVEVAESRKDIPDDVSEWKILNLYAGIGGNRRFWPDEAEIVHVEYNEEIAEALRKLHPEDEVIVGDAHEYLLEHFDEFDFIWSSPPCPTHSRMRKQISMGNGADPVYPDMKLYEEILLLKGYFDGMWVVENVKSWYDPLIEPQQRDRHYYWANFDIPEDNELSIDAEIGNEMVDDVTEEVLLKQAKKFGFTEDEFELIPNPSGYPKDKVIRNMVHPEIGEIILKAAVESKGDSDE